MHENKEKAIERLIKNSAEIITADEFRDRVLSGEELTHYIGFEISGYVHMGQGIMSALVIKDLQELGVKCTVWLADWHTWINDKLDGTRETAAAIGRGYFTEAIKASLMAVGADPEKVEFRLASEWYAKDAMQYWDTVMLVAKHTTLARMQRSISILGRKEEDNVDFAKLIYPAMQAADIFYQNVDIAHAGMDQRKAHVVMRDVANQVAPNQPKPIALHHPLLTGLMKQGDVLKPEMGDVKIGEKDDADKEVSIERVKELAKMSKSAPGNALFVHDSAEEMEAKINKSFCPLGNDVLTQNLLPYGLIPVMNWAKHILFWNRSTPFVIERKPEHGGNVEFETYEALEEAYAKGEVHPMDLKAAVARDLIELLAPVREHFAKPEIAAKKAELDKVLENR